jgi:divalent metal cation (Fe/Co/Zn/Cd) transporter
MGSIHERREGLKTHWRNLSARARLGESFGFIDALSILYKAGHVSRELALELLRERIAPDDLREYRRVRQAEPIS